jgi:WD40 repeat protein/predicted Ser/Thr protein kinase
LPLQTNPLSATAVQAPSAIPAPPGFEILGELGRGGMGVVYKARQRSLNRVVALKMILAGAHAGPQELDRFRLEAEAAAALQHPNIVQVYEVGEFHGLPYMALEFVDGPSLSQKYAGAPQSPRVAAQLVETLARAMHYAHTHGVVHRDLKPANVLLTSDGTPKVTDFGLAKRLEAPTKHTQTGAIMGTAGYMAPEQAAGRNKEVGPAADIHALGAILYELLTGRPPFQGPTTLDAILRVLSDDPLPPAQLQPKVPRDLEVICLHCLQKVPQKRYATAQDLAEDLGRFLAGEPIRARPIGPLGRMVKWVRRRPVLAMLAATLVVLAAVSFSLLYWNWRQADAARHNERALRHDAEDALTRARMSLYLNSIAQAEREWRDSNAREARRILDECPVERRGWEWHYARRQYHGELLTLEGHADDLTSVAFSRNGRWLATGSLDKTARIWDARDGRELHVCRAHTGAVTAVGFSPDSSRLATAGRDRLVILWDPETGTTLRQLSGHRGGVFALAFSPDGKHLATGGEDRVVLVWDLEQGQIERALAGHTHFVLGLAFSPDGKRLASGSADNTIRLWDWAGTAEPLVLQGHTSEVRAVAFNPAGTRLASASWDKNLRVWDAKTGEPVRTLLGHTQGVYSVAYSPDGRRVASASGDRTVRLWDAEAGRALLVLPGHSHFVTGVAYSPDGQRLALARNDHTAKVWDARHRQEMLRVSGPAAGIDALAFLADAPVVAVLAGNIVRQSWDAASGEEIAAPSGSWPVPSAPRFTAEAGGSVVVEVGEGAPIRLELRGHTRKVRVVALHPNGSRLATGGEDATVRLWDTLTGQQALVLKGHDAPITHLAFSSDGHRLASRDEGGTVRVWDATPLE